jgi:hypothetical protein
VYRSLPQNVETTARPVDADDEKDGAAALHLVSGCRVEGAAGLGGRERSPGSSAVPPLAFEFVPLLFGFCKGIRLRHPAPTVAA